MKLSKLQTDKLKEKHAQTHHNQIAEQYKCLNLDAATEK